MRAESLNMMKTLVILAFVEMARRLHPFKTKAGAPKCKVLAWLVR